MQGLGGQDRSDLEAVLTSLWERGGVAQDMAANGSGEHLGERTFRVCYFVISPVLGALDTVGRLQAGQRRSKIRPKTQYYLVGHHPSLQAPRGIPPSSSLSEPWKKTDSKRVSCSCQYTSLIEFWHTCARPAEEALSRSRILDWNHTPLPCIEHENEKIWVKRGPILNLKPVPF